MSEVSKVSTLHACTTTLAVPQPLLPLSYIVIIIVVSDLVIIRLHIIFAKTEKATETDNDFKQFLHYFSNIL